MFRELATISGSDITRNSNRSIRVVDRITEEVKFSSWLPSPKRNCPSIIRRTPPLSSAEGEGRFTIFAFFPSPLNSSNSLHQHHHHLLLLLQFFLLWAEREAFSLSQRQSSALIHLRQVRNLLHFHPISRCSVYRWSNFHENLSFSQFWVYTYFLKLKWVAGDNGDQ